MNKESLMIAPTSPRTRFSHNAGWMLLGALLALSPQMVGCSLLEDEPAPSPTATESTASPAKQLPEVAPRPESESAAAAVDKKNAEATPKEKSEPAPALTEVASAEEGEPFVKRLVIASAVEEREPVELETAQVNTPVLAFVELKHLGAEEAGIVVTFEHESGKKVGHVKLNVPGESNRYRTWARTRNIRDAGEWTAVVHSASGEELARKSFTVAG